MWRSTGFPSSKEYKDHDNIKYRHPPPSPHGGVGVQISNRLLHILVGCFVFGILLLFVNVLQLRNLNNRGFDDSPVAQKPVALICGKNIHTGYLMHLYNVLRRVGYVTTETISNQWDVLWSHEYPFALDELKEHLHKLRPYQKVNHFPGSGFICNKASLAVSHFPFHPMAFEIPKSKDQFLEEVKKFPHKMWVEKSNSHRGIRIKSPSEIRVDGTSSDAFVEEFISNPYLIDGRKFDIGIYVVLTSINPLRVYVFEDEVLIRFCVKNYHPLDVKDEKQYVVGDEYTQPWELPSLAHLWKQGKFSRKHTILAHLKNEGKDADKVWQDMTNAIKKVYVKKEIDLISSSSAYGDTRNFFELVRFDFILDENMNAWLMEVNMSPNLSSGSHADNALMYEQVIFNLFGLVGVSNRLAHTTRSSPESEKNMIVADHNIISSHDACASKECKMSCIHKSCQTCHQCLTEDQRCFLKAAYYEHVNRGGYRRVFPPPMVSRSILVQTCLLHKLMYQCLLFLKEHHPDDYPGPSIMSGIGVLSCKRIERGATQKISKRPFGRSEPISFPKPAFLLVSTEIREDLVATIFRRELRTYIIYSTNQNASKNGCNQSLSFLGADQEKRRLWKRIGYERVLTLCLAVWKQVA